MGRRRRRRSSNNRYHTPQVHQQAITYKTAKALIGRELVEPPTTHVRTKAVFDGPCDQEPLSRGDAVFIAQLRSGHCRKLAAYRSIVETNFSPICPHCDMEAETLEHWLQDCPATAVKRIRVFGGAAPQLSFFTQGCPSVCTWALARVNACRQQQQQHCKSSQGVTSKVESECKKVGLHLNTKKTKVMAINTPESIVLKTVDGQTLQVEKDFKYLGSWINSSEKDIKVRKALAWNALHSMHVLWKSKINFPLKRSLFVATVKSVLTYGSDSWTLTVQQ